jgi:trimeric autotransporter adhesin
MSTIWGTPDDDTRIGTSGNDTIYGLKGNDSLKGLGGDDTLDGGLGNDTMTGGVGDDTYIVDSYLDVVEEYAGGGTKDHVKSSVSYTLGRYVEDLTLLGSGDIDGKGNESQNVITGNSGDNDLWGMGGNDILKGGGGNDSLSGGIGADTMLGGTGDDYYYVDDSGDVVKENVDEGHDTVQATVAFSLSDHVEDLTLWGSAAIDGTGNELANKIKGNSGANILKGEGGNDTLSGGGGLDTLHGGTGDDHYLLEDADLVVEAAGAGFDEVTAYFDYTLTANVESLVLAVGSFGGGNALDNFLLGNASNNTLTGGAGNDSISGWLGADTMIGGLDNDVYVVDDAGDVVIELAGEGEDEVASLINNYTLGAFVENLTLGSAPGVTQGTGNNLDNKIVGNNAGNVLFGLAGNDDLNGMQGLDFMYGGLGDDSYVVHSAGDQAIEAAGEGMDSVFAWSSYTLGANVEYLTLWAGAVDGTGNDLDNGISGNDADNTLMGGAGSDYLIGNLGKDTLIGGTGDDYFYVDQSGESVVELANEGVDTVYASANFALTANVENLYLTEGAATDATGNGSNNYISGNTNNNLLIGGGGQDTLDGHEGADTMIGGADNDLYFVDNFSDIVQEAAGQGTDNVRTSVTYVLNAGSAVEVLETTNADGTINLDLVGNELANTIIGNDGQNTLVGGLGQDKLIGNWGGDTFAWLSLAEIGLNEADADIVGGDFNYLNGDTLAFNLIDADETIAGDQAFTFIGDAAFTAAGQIRAYTNGGNTFIQLNTDADLAYEATLKVEGIHSVNAGWFTF